MTPKENLDLRRLRSSRMDKPLTFLWLRERISLPRGQPAVICHFLDSLKCIDNSAYCHWTLLALSAVDLFSLPRDLVLRCRARV